MERSLDRVFSPRSVAVIGASEVPGKAAERRTLGIGSICGINKMGGFGK